MLPSTRPSAEQLNSAEKAFLTAVFACRGINAPPTSDEFREGLEALSAYAQQAEDNPVEDRQVSRVTGRWLASLSDEERVMLAAVAWMRFHVTKPSIFQLRAAHRELFGPDLCPDCD